MKRLIPLGAVVVLVLIACGAASTPAPQAIHDLAVTPVRPTVRMLAAERRRDATREARALLRRFVVPRGASRTRIPRSFYGGLLRSSGASPAAEVADRHRLWSVHASLATVASFVGTHRPRGFRLDASSSSSGTQIPPNRAWSFSARGHARFVNITAVGLPGRTIVRVDAQVVWIYPRSPKEKVPAAVREIDVKAPTVARRVTDPAKVRQIVRWLDALPIAPPGIALGCPLERSPDIKLVSRSASGARLATALVPSSKAWLCNSIQFSIGGRRQWPLIDRLRGHGFVYHVQGLLGVPLIETHR